LINKSLFLTSQLDDVINFLKSNKRDVEKLEYIKNVLEQNKKLYASDREYLKNLIKQYSKENIQENLNNNSSKDKFKSGKSANSNTNYSFCGKCGKKFGVKKNFCPNCGSSKNNQNTSPLKQNFNPNLTQNISKQKHTGIKSYQILSVIGGVLGLFVILAHYAMFKFVDIMASSFGNGIENSSNQYISVALPLVIIIYISCFIIPFVIKKTKIVGIYLIASALIVLIAYSFVAILGFALLLPAGIIALRKN